MHQGESGRVASCCENAFAGWSDDMILYSNTADTECTYPRFLGPERTAPSREPGSLPSSYRSQSSFDSKVPRRRTCEGAHTSGRPKVSYGKGHEFG